MVNFKEVDLANVPAEFLRQSIGKALVCLARKKGVMPEILEETSDLIVDLAESQFLGVNVNVHSVKAVD